MYSDNEIEEAIPPADSVSISGNEKEDISINTAVIGDSLRAIAMMMFNKTQHDVAICLRCGKPYPTNWDNDICKQCEIDMGDREKES